MIATATPAPEPNRRLLKGREAAAYLSVSPRKLWSLTAGKKLPAVRIDRSVRYDPADLDRFIDDSKPGR